MGRSAAWCCLPTQPQGSQEGELGIHVGLQHEGALPARLCPIQPPPTRGQDKPMCPGLPAWLVMLSGSLKWPHTL